MGAKVEDVVSLGKLACGGIEPNNNKAAADLSGSGFIHRRDLQIFTTARTDCCENAFERETRDGNRSSKGFG
jgi:hypothetical protein